MENNWWWLKLGNPGVCQSIIRLCTQLTIWAIRQCTISNFNFINLNWRLEIVKYDKSDLIFRNYPSEIKAIKRQLVWAKLDFGVIAEAWICQFWKLRDFYVYIHERWACLWQHRHSKHFCKHSCLWHHTLKYNEIQWCKSILHASKSIE